MRTTRITEVIVRVTEVIETDPPWLQEVAKLYEMASASIAIGCSHLALPHMQRIRLLYIAAGYPALPAPLSDAYHRALTSTNNRY